ncbi:MAG: hypothetical protein LBK52_04005, partial [Deltaproteobacteria bacterium]|nr:hypothetical protein [Deltaproteobacteria bacterium]
LELDSGPEHYELGALSLTQVSVRDLAGSLTAQPPNLPLLWQSVQSLELASGEVLRDSTEAFYLKRLFWETRPDREFQGGSSEDGAEEEPGPPLLVLTAEGIRLRPGMWLEAEPAGPAEAAFLEALGETAAGSLSLSWPLPDPKDPAARPVRTARLRLTADNQGRFDLTLRANPQLLENLITSPSPLALVQGTFGPGEVSFSDCTFLMLWAQALGRRTGQPPLEAVRDFAAPWWDNLETQGVFQNLFSLKAESELFVQTPQRAALAWQPPAGFPMAVILRLQKENPQALRSLLSQNKDEQMAIAKYFAYVIIKELNLTLAVNGRLPVLFQTVLPEPIS